MYTKEPKNAVADALNRIPKQGDTVDDVNAELPFLSRQNIKTNPTHFQKTVTEEVKMVIYKNRIYTPKDLRTRIMKWYHHYLCHPGDSRVHKNLASILYQENMEDEIRQFMKQCTICQRLEKKKHGKISPKNVEQIRWDTMCIDLVGPYKVIDQKGNGRIHKKTYRNMTLMIWILGMNY